MTATEAHADLVVVGGGAMGLATAWAAAPRARVVLVERFAAGHERGASHGAERIWRHAYVEPAYVDMALAAEEGWRALERAAGRPLLHRVGCVEHGEGGDLDGLAASAGSRGVRTERLTPGEAARRWPALNFATDVLVQPDAGWVRAADGLAALAAEAARAGADLRFGAPVIDLAPVAGGGVRVVTADGRAAAAPVVVVTAGAWTSDVLAPFAVPLPPLVTTEEHVFFVARRPGAVVPSFIHWAGPDRYGLPAADGRVKVGEHHTGAVTTGDTRSGVPDPDRVARTEAYARDWLPGVVPEVTGATTCLYTSTPTRHFVLDRWGPVVVGAGFSGHGFKFVPEVGRRLAALALDGAPAVAPFSFAAHATAG
ncbi:MAG TPA: FAD-dependent oxidoreductase [Acidimicrobiales bacterium]|nr:FAD-dependent oxidoreductase [Acidimicrobiales bacterium]